MLTLTSISDLSGGMCIRTREVKRSSALHAGARSFPKERLLACVRKESVPLDGGPCWQCVCEQTTSWVPASAADTLPLQQACGALTPIERQLLMNRRKKVLVIGLDCAPPELVFEQWRDALPNFRRVMDDGVWGKLESCIPAITVPAWSAMMSSKDPGTLGFYGFRNRGDYSYEKHTLANANSVKTDRVWDILSRAGKQVITIGVPQTYPPKPVNGIQVGCFLSPSTTNPDRPYTYPASLMQEIEATVGDYLVDVPNFRTDDKEYLLRQIYTMTEKRFQLVKKWMVEKE